MLVGDDAEAEVMDEQLGYVDKLRMFKRDARLYIMSSSLGAFAFGFSSVVFNLYMVEIGFQEDFLGFFYSISMFATAGLALIAGFYTDRHSRKRIILTAAIVSNMAIVMQYFFLDPLPLMASQIFFGLSGAFSQVSWSPYITDLSTDKERTHLFGFAGGMSLLSVLAGNLIGGLLPNLLDQVLGTGGNLFWPYRLTLWVSLIPLFLSTLLIIPMSRDTPQEKSPTKGPLRVSNIGFTIKWTSAVSIIGLGAGMIVLYFNLYFQTVFNADSAQIGIIFALNTAALSIGNFASPWLADKIGKVNTMVVTEALSVPFLLMLTFAPSIYIGAIAYISRAVLMNMAWPVGDAFFMEGLEKEERATAMGVVRTGDSLARAVAANIGGWMLAAGFYREPYVIVSGLYVIGIVALFLFFRNKEKELAIRRAAEVVEEEPEIELDIT